MIFKIKPEQFLDDLNTVVQVVPQHTTFPILSNIKIEAINNKLRIFGTDLDTSISYTTEVAEIEEEGTIVLPARTLYSMLREIEKEITFSVEGNRVKITYSQGYSYLPLMEEEDFPAEPDIDKESAYKTDIEEIKESIDKIVFIVPEDSAKRNMSGMLWDYKEGNLKLAATDSYRLGYKKIKIDLGDDAFEIVIPPKILKQVLSTQSKEMWIGIDESRIYCIGDKYTMVSRLIKADFPNYESAIPENNNNILNVEKSSFTSSLKRVSVFSDDKPKTVVFNLGQEMSVGVSSEVGESREEIKGEYNGDTFNIALSARYLLDMVRKIDSKNIKLSFGKSDTAVIIEGDDEDTMYLLMPVVLE